MLSIGRISAFLFPFSGASSVCMSSLSCEMYVALQYGNVTGLRVSRCSALRSLVLDVGTSIFLQARHVGGVHICIPILLFSGCILLILHNFISLRHSIAGRGIPWPRREGPAGVPA